MLVIIDNCSLLQLVYSAGYSQQLVDLENFVNQGNISLITHENILVEWAKHRPKDKSRKKDKLLKSKGSQAVVGSAMLPSVSPNNIDHLDLQYEQIDRLLKGAKRLTTPEFITAEFGYRLKNGLAPLHKKKDGLSDWEIIGTAGNYCDINGISPLYFISHNSTDFGSADADEITIHPDIQNRFPKVEFKYYTDLGQFILDVNKLVLPQRELRYNIMRNERFAYKSSMKSNDIDSIYFLLSDLYAEVPFIPLHILWKKYPFANATGSNPYYSIFTMHYVRDDFVRLLENIEIISNEVIVKNTTPFDSVRDLENKLQYVFTRLTNNLIFNLSSDVGHKNISILYRNNIACQCIRCNYQRLELDQSLNKVKDTGNSIEDKLKIAYLNYKLGNLESAAIRFLDLREESYNAKQYMIYFICVYNLANLANFISNPFLQSDLSADVLKKLKEIDPIEECVKLKSYTDYDFLVFLADSAFFKDAVDAISSLVVQLDDHYNSCVNGGHGSNSFVWKLVQEFATLDTYTNNNCIVYDAYSNFERLFELVIKGLFASHALKNSGSSSFDEFDDYWVGKFVLYGNKQAIYKYLNRYKLKSLAYKTIPEDDDSFMNMAANFLKSEKATRLAYFTFRDKVNRNFFHKYHAIFDNLLTMATLLELKTTDVKRFASLLFKYIQTETSLSNRQYETIADFMKKKGRLIDHLLLEKYLAHFVAKEEKYETDVLRSILKCYPDKGLMGDDYKIILKHTLTNKIEKGHNPNIDLIVTLFLKSPDETRPIITQQIEDCLKTLFHYDLYYMSLIYEMIPLRKRTLYRLLDEVQINKKQETIGVYFFGYEPHFIERLDSLLNVCFKYNIATKGKRFDRLKQQHNYYKWVLNMEGFNYEEFDISWVNHYSTDFYCRAMSKSPKLKTTLIEYLRTNFDQRVERTLLKITHYVSKR